MNLLSQGRLDSPMEAMNGPFGAGAPGLGYREYLAEFDQNREMWRQIVPGQSGRGLALGRWGLHNYQEYEDYAAEPVMIDSDPLWVPLLVEWASVTILDGAQIQPDPFYIEQFHGSEINGEDALPVVGIVSANCTWSALSGPWSVHTPEGLWWEVLDGPGKPGELETVMPVQHVLPIDDDAMLVEIAEAISAIERIWPMDAAGPSVLDSGDGWPGEHEELRDQALMAGHTEDCIDVHYSLGTELEFLKCTWDWQAEQCMPCGGAAHITAVVDSFLDNQPYEQLVFSPGLISAWDHLRLRNLRFYSSLLDIQEHERSKGRSWYYSYLQRWSPWGHSSQVPELHRAP